MKMERSKWRPLLALVVVLVSGVVLAACGGGSSSSSSTEESSSAPAETGPSGGALAEAKAAIKPYVGQPSAFPVTEKLKEIPKGDTVAFMDCGAPICAAMYEGLKPATELMGVNLERYKAGFTANTVGPAFDSAVANKPDAVIITAIEPALYSKQLKELQSEGIPIVTTGVTTAEEYGIENPQYGKPEVETLAKLQADYIAVEFGSDSNIAYFGIPELAITKVSEAAFKEELEHVCPTCQVHFDSVPVADLGNKAPSDVVSDLEANPETNVVDMIAGEISLGLPAALKAAGIEVKTLSGSANPQNLLQLKEGTETASLASDVPVLAFTLLDQAAREMTGQKVTGLEAEGLGVLQFLTQKDITFDPTEGWNGYPDFVEQFSKLWGIEG
jgi:ribose transport system substrate-binding protein